MPNLKEGLTDKEMIDILINNKREFEEIHTALKLLNRRPDIDINEMLYQQTLKSISDIFICLRCAFRNYDNRDELIKNEAELIKGIINQYIDSQVVMYSKLKI
ncbi:hypothetical protein [Vallitalea guaymasensis]|uniref:hypothetical protein n=1 Tax=Vallitalea guaymasensis TaxID=1185412 RepID=UPI000DE2F0FE|nr:hypothetical protein [Vallitalea guaymasensis]